MTGGLSSYIILAGQKFIAGLTGFALIFLLAANLSPSEFGLYLLCSGVSAGLANIYFQWMANIVQKYYISNQELISMYIMKCSKKAIILFFASSLSLVFLLDFGGLFMGLAIFISGSTTGILIVLMQLLNAEQSHIEFAKASLLKSITMLIITPLTWYSTGAVELLIFAIGLSSLFPIWYILKNHKIKYNCTISNSHHLWNYGKYFLLISFSTAIIDNSDKIILSVVDGYSAVGSYGTVQLLSQQVVGASLAIIFLYWSPKIILDFNNNDLSLYWEKYTKMESKVIFLGGVIVLIVLFAVSSKYFIEMLNTVENVSAAPYILLSIYTGCLKGYLVDFRLILEGDSKYIFFTTLFGASVSLFLGFYFIEIWGGVGAAIASFISFYLSMLISFIRLYILVKFRSKDFLVIFAPIFLLCSMELIK